jgi:tetratricopeptide (TPR) repeat protein
VSKANARWHELRSNSMLKLAQQQFDTGDLDQSEKTLVEAIGIDPANAPLHVLAGRIAIEHGELERAHDRFERALELNPKEVAALYYQGLVYQRWQQYQKAYDAYEKAYTIQSDNISFLLAMGEMLVSLGKPNDAIALLEKKVTFFDQNSAIRSALGQLYYMKRDYPRAVEYLKQASNLAPDNLQMIENLANAQVMAGQYAEAVRHLERLVNEPAEHGRADIQQLLAMAYERSGRLDDAAHVYVQLTRNDPRNVAVWARLASLSLLRDDTSSALAAANRVMALDGARPDGYIIAALVWQKRGRYDQAVRLFDRAASLSPTNVDPVILRGIAQEHAGNKAAAASSYQEALRLDPKDIRAKNLLERLSQVDQAH